MERDVASALMHDIAHLEVGLRNAYDRAFVAATPAGAPHWVFDPARWFPVTIKTAANRARYDANRTPREQIERAVREVTSARRGGPVPSAPPGKVIAEITFGFWRYLSTKAHDQSLWVPHLHKAFVPGTSRPQIDEPIGRIHKLRNRVAHHEPLLRQDLSARYDDILSVAALVSPRPAALHRRDQRLPIHDRRTTMTSV